jgi:hypothetical protein
MKAILSYIKLVSGVRFIQPILDDLTASSTLLSGPTLADLIVRLSPILTILSISSSVKPSRHDAKEISGIPNDGEGAI